MSKLITVNGSRRRVEAMKFLCGISLDGTCYSDVQNLHSSNAEFDMEKDNATKGQQFINNNEGTSSKQGFISGNVDLEVIKDIKVNHVYFHSNSSDSDNAADLSFAVIEPIANTNLLASSKGNKCTRTRSSGFKTKNKIISSSRKKKIQHTSTCSDSERHFGSSCESVCPAASSQLKPTNLICNSINATSGKPKIKFVKSIKDHKFNGERIIMVTKRRIPYLVCSFIPYGNCEKSRSDHHKEISRKRHTARTRPVSTSGDPYNLFEAFGIIKSEDGQEVSYGKLLVPTRVLKDCADKKHSSECSSDLQTHTVGHNRHALGRCYSYEQGGQRGVTHSTTSPPLPILKDSTSLTFVYNPLLLDDPELIAGKHRTLLTFSSYVTSIIDYVRPCDLKKEINDKFKDKFPHIKLTLSKLRSLKKEMSRIIKSESGSELLTIAQAYVYFEKLILRGLINKQNRKLCAAASLLLSAKLNDFKGDGLRMLVERIENVFRINRRELFESEFAILVALEFGLHLPVSEVFPHYQRLLYES